MPTDSLRLPRTLVNQLLRHAQRAAGPSQGWVLRDTQGQLRAVPLPTEADSLAATASALPDVPFAFYRSFKSGHNALTAGEIAALAKCASFYLEMSLDTKGVLQLRAWRLENSQATPLDVAIMDSADLIPAP